MTTTSKIRQFTLDEYHQLIEFDFFPKNERIELINGQLIKMAAKGTNHETCLRRLLRELPNLIGCRATLQCQAPISILPNSEPEPDFAIVKNREDDYLAAHPTPSDVLLVIEVSDSSLTYDQETKLPLYAQANISEYWIFNLLESWLEAYSQPYQINPKKFGYAYRHIFFPHQTIKIPCFPDLLLDLSKILPVSDHI